PPRCFLLLIKRARGHSERQNRRFIGRWVSSCARTYPEPHRRCRLMAHSARGTTTMAFRNTTHVSPLAVSPLEAGRLLSLGISRVYALMRAGELQSYQD